MVIADEPTDVTQLLPVEDSRCFPAPAWTAELSIYQVCPRGFTSPGGAGDGHGSGTFRSLAERIPYIASLGVTAIWLAGFHQATAHFYGIWSTYAAYRHDRFDPSLGDAEDFGHLVQEAHRHGVKVLLEAVSHGVVRDSPLVEEHPDWFLPDGTWGMRDFDYSNPEFRRWWVQTWLHYVAEYGVDGFRVDVDMVDRTVWDEICQRCADAGHPVVVIVENERYHMSQRDWDAFSPDIAADWHANRRRFQVMEVSCHDAGWVCGPGNHYRVKGRRALFGYSVAFAHRIPLFFAGEEFNADQVSLPAVTRGLFGSGGSGGWMYGSQLPWHQLRDPAKAAFHDDVARMFAIRRKHSDVLNADRWKGDMVAVDTTTDALLKPYARFEKGRKAVVVCGNESDRALTLSLRLPLADMGLDPTSHYLVEDEWNGGRSVIAGAQLAAGLDVKIGPDSAPGGGLAVLTITSAPR